MAFRSADVQPHHRLLLHRANSQHSALVADACKAVHVVLLPSIGIAAGTILLTKLCERRSPLAQAFRSPGTGAVRLTPRRLASATSYQPRVSGNGHTSAGANPLLHPAQPDAAPNVGPQPAVPFAVQTPPSSGDIVIHNAVPEQQKVLSGTHLTGRPQSVSLASMVVVRFANLCSCRLGTSIRAFKPASLGAGNLAERHCSRGFATAAGQQQHGGGRKAAGELVDTVRRGTVCRGDEPPVRGPPWPEERDGVRPVAAIPGAHRAVMAARCNELPKRCGKRTMTCLALHDADMHTAVLALMTVTEVPQD